MRGEKVITGAEVPDEERIRIRVERVLVNEDQVAFKQVV